MTWDMIRRYRPDLDRYVLTGDQASLREPAPIAGLEIILIGQHSPVGLIQETMTVNEQGFDPAASDVGVAMAEKFRPNLAGCVAVTARWHRQPVAAGMLRPVYGGLCEIVGITTLAPFRRRGFAAAVSARLAALALDRGAVTVFLTTDDDDARRVYRRVGFHDLPAATTVS